MSTFGPLVLSLSSRGITSIDGVFGPDGGEFSGDDAVTLLLLCGGIMYMLFSFIMSFADAVYLFYAQDDDTVSSIPRVV